MPCSSSSSYRPPTRSSSKAASWAAASTSETGRQPAAAPRRSRSSMSSGGVSMLSLLAIRRPAYPISGDGEPDVVAHHQGEEGGVEPVQGTPVGPEDAPGVLGPHVALDVGLEEVADRRGDRHPEPEPERVEPRHPVLVEPRDLHGDERADDAAGQALEGLVGRDGGGERAAAEEPPGEVGDRVAEERAGEDVDDHRV